MVTFTVQLMVVMENEVGEEEDEVGGFDASSVDDASHRTYN